MMKMDLITGTRTSQLALWQTNHVVERLQAAWPDLRCQIQPFVTKGDKTLDRPLPEIGGKGLFTAELEAALLEGQIDLAVHSLKDLPVAGAPGVTIGAILSRADVRDGLVARNGRTLATLPAGARAGTSSLRRQAQLLAARPDLEVVPIRGNVDTRVRKVLRGDYDAAVLAAAGLKRLDLLEHVTEWLPLELMLPAPGQGALAVQCRTDDAETLRLLSAIDDATTRTAVSTERHFLQALGGGCSAPLAAYAFVEENGRVQLQALVADPAGRQVIRLSGSDHDPQRLVAQLAEEARQQGADRIMQRTMSTEKTAARPLAGRRIVVTRAAAQAEEMATQLRELGATPLLMPAIEIAPLADSSELDAAIGRLASYDWIIFTSVNGVAIFWERLAAAGKSVGHLNGARVAAIGPATADSLAERGVHVTYVPEEYVAESLAAGLGDVRGRRILLPRAELARKTLEEMLVAAGASVDNVATYRTLPAGPNPAAVSILEAGVDAVTFTSSSTVRNFVTTLEQQLPPERVRQLLQQTAVACIGPITVGTARELGLEPAVIATEYTIPGLIAALVDYFS